MTTCGNCDHDVKDHGASGCHYGHCFCPFDFYRANLNMKEQNVTYEDARPTANPERVKAADRQVGGDHYRQASIQPWQIWKAYDLDPWQASIIKYVLRAGRKLDVPAIQDYEKAKHYLEYLIEREKEEG